MFMYQDFIGTVALATTIIGLIPQVWKVFHTQSAQDFSWVMMINYIISTIAWIIHGIQIEDSIVLYTGLAGLLAFATLLMQKVYYAGRKQPTP